MFPLNWNLPFRKKDGSLVKLNDVIGKDYTLPTASTTTKGGIKVGTGATMSGEVLNIDAQIPSYSAEESGKVLKVNESGELEWDEAGGAGGVYVGTTNPTSDIGNNGDYYYKRSNSGEWLQSSNYTFYSSQTYYGNEFVAKEPIKILRIGGMLHKTVTGSLRIGNLIEVLQTVNNISFTANQWSFVDLDSPIELNTGDHFIIGFDASETQHIPYAQSESSYSGNTDIAEYVKAYYGEPYPGTADNNTRVAVSFEYESDYYIVTDQYIKESDIWTKIK